MVKIDSIDIQFLAKGEKCLFPFTLSLAEIAELHKKGEIRQAEQSPIFADISKPVLLSVAQKLLDTAENIGRLVRGNQ